MTEKTCKMQIMMPELHLTIDLSVSGGCSGGPWGSLQVSGHEVKGCRSTAYATYSSF